MPKQITQPAKSQAARLALAGRTRDRLGRFEKRSDLPQLPVTANVNPASQFVSIPNPIGPDARTRIYYNPDEAFRTDQENASRMLFDGAIFSSLQERQLASALLPWQIVPPNEKNRRQRYAAECLTDQILDTPNLTDFFRNFLDAIWFGRSASYVDYRWDFTSGRRRMKVKKWTPVHGDSLLFTDDGLAGYKIGIQGANPELDFVCVEGRGERIPEQQRDAWISHHYQRVAGEWRTFYSAASQFGLGLRSRLYPTWLFKVNLYAQLANWCEKWGGGFMVNYFEMGNDASMTAVATAMQKQIGSQQIMFPRSMKDEAPEGIEMLDPPGDPGQVLGIIDNLNKYTRLVICGSEMTAESKTAGLGSNLATVQQNSFGRNVRFDALSLQETLSRHFVRVLQDWNGFSDLPPLRFEFSFDLGDPKEKLEKAKILFDMGIRVAETELLQAAGFTVPLTDEEVTEAEPEENGVEA
jgi:phage gp29-like protein